MTGKPSQEETQRNTDLIRDVESRQFTQVQLVAKYGITQQRIWQIINRNKKRRAKNN